jgi:FtsP/CotA-like multicopper oxidase with cupredoxin domain
MPLTCLGVLFNDVDGYDRNLITTSSTDLENVAGIARKTVKIPCGETRRLRFVNLASHARFYIWFSDYRRFKVIELDGVSYQPAETNLFELASGQRVSILVKTDPNVPASCTGAYIVAVSDPRINGGSDRCPLPSTHPSRSIQYVHGYLDIEKADGTTDSKARKAVLDPEDNAEVQDKWKLYRMSNAAPAGGQGYVVESNQWMKDRPDLGFLSWRMLYYANRDTPNANTNYGFVTAANRVNSIPVGISGAHDCKTFCCDGIAVSVLT